jgi:ferritin-like metal-binding protein YciE
MGLLGKTIETRRDLFVHKLGAALTMEKTILDMLPQLEEHSNHEPLKSSLGRHYEQTQQHVANLERSFEVLGEDVDDAPCPAIEGLEKEGQANLKMVDDSLNDAVVVGGVCETEHHEIAVYEGLIVKARSLGEEQVVPLLEENLRQEQETLQRAQQMATKLAEGLAPVA